MTPQQGSIDAVALIFRLNNRMVTQGLDGLTDDEIWIRPCGSANSIGWLLGHLAESRGSLLAELGDAAGMPWEKQFARGSAPGAPASYPSRTVLEQAWRGTSHRMRDAFAGLTPDRLTATPARQGLPGVTDVASLIAFYAFHESYHVGQISYARRLLGKSGLAG
jgi:uncharacterized damage-inducible protein DinB